MSAEIQGIYVALFGRPADPGGLAYWNEVTKNGADLSEMLRVLPSLPEYTSRFDGMDNGQVVASIYQALFGRAPDSEGLAFFVEALASGAQSIATIAVHILNGAQGTDKADVDAKIDAAQMFTAALDTDDEIAAYNADAVASAQSFLNGINRDNPATEESVSVAVAEAVSEGQPPVSGPGGPGGGGGALPAALVAINASSEADMLATLNKYADDVFTDASADLFGDLPEGHGRQQAIASGVYEQIQLFGKFKTLADIKATVTFHTETEYAKYEFINKVQGATTQAEMVAALQFGKTLSHDRQDLIEKWSDDDAPKAAQDRAAALASDDYTRELAEVASASPGQLQVLANALLKASGPFYGVGHIINGLAAVEFNDVHRLTGTFSIGDGTYTDVVVGTDAANDTLALAQRAGDPSTITLYSEGLEVVSNSRAAGGSATVNLAGANGIEKIVTDFTGASGTPSQFYLAASAGTSFVVKGSTASETTMSLRFKDPLTADDTIDLALEGNAGYTAFYFGSGFTAPNLSLSVSGPSAVSVRNVIDNISVSGEGSLTYITHNVALKNFDASAVAGDVKIIWGGDGGASKAEAGSVIKTGIGNDSINLGASTGNLTINAGAGNDTIWGGSGADTFVFDGENFGNDTIHGFQVATDTIDLSAYREDAEIVVQDAPGGNAIVSIDGVGSITVVGVSAAALAANMGVVIE